MTPNLKQTLLSEYEHDTVAHSKGRCSYSLLALCSAEEQRIKLWLSTAFDRLKQSVQTETLKAAGGCKNCWGKGYATTIEYAVEGMGDFKPNQNAGRATKLPEMRFCSCERGKELKKQFAHVEQSIREEVVRMAEGMKKGHASIVQLMVTEQETQNGKLHYEREYGKRDGYNQALSDLISLLSKKP